VKTNLVDGRDSHRLANSHVMSMPTVPSAPQRRLRSMYHGKTIRLVEANPVPLLLLRLTVDIIPNLVSEAVR
jgi:hypothetical protein